MSDLWKKYILKLSFYLPIVDPSLFKNKPKKTVEKVFECSICHKNFSRNNSLQYHTEYKVCVNKLTNANKKPKKVYKCNLCAKTFCNNIVYDHHVNANICNKYLYCLKCFKRFRKQQSFDFHIQNGCNSNNVMCECGIPITKYGLKQHRKSLKHINWMKMNEN